MSLRYALPRKRRTLRGRRSADPVLRAGDAAHVSAVCAAVVAAGGFDSVSDDLAVTVLTLGRQRVNRTLEAVEDVMAAGQNDLEGLVVVVSADVADSHGHLPSRVVYPLDAPLTTGPYGSESFSITRPTSFSSLSCPDREDARALSGGEVAPARGP